ncbi:MAG TPA: hypothetical protein PKO28_00610 [Bacilli bacterium]|nr:hypothetical protein [Bacilli bacterium]HPS18722.1 hypothetical protein [Bacilli bacterium]
MKKWPFLAVLVLSLTSCDKARNPYAIFTCQNVDMQLAINASTFVEISNSELSSLIDSGTSFPLFLFSESCSYCETAKQTLASYASNYHCLIYSYEYAPQSYSLLVASYPNLFPNQFVSPSLYLISESSLTYNFQTNVLLNYGQFRPVANQHLLYSPIQAFTEQNSFDYILDNQEDNFFFIYDNFDAPSLELFNEILFPLAIDQKNKKVTLIDKKILQNGVFSNICASFQIAESESNIAIWQNKKGGIKTTPYLSDNGVELSEWFTIYLSE